MSYLVYDINIVREVLDECTIQINTVPFLLNVKIVIREVEIVHPVVFRGTVFKQLEYSS